MARKVFGQKVKDGGTFTYTGVITDDNGDPIDITDEDIVNSMTLSYYNKATGATINGRNAQDVLGVAVATVYPGANEHILNANGTLIWNSEAADSSFVTTADVTVVGRYIYSFQDANDITRIGIHEFEFTIEALIALS